MAPEVFFHPEFANDNFTEPLSSVVDKTIQVIQLICSSRLIQLHGRTVGGSLLVGVDKIRSCS